MNQASHIRRAQSRKILAAAVASLAAAPLLTLLPQARAADLYWDINGTTPDSGPDAQPSGTWNGVNTFFNTDPTGGAGGSLTAVTTDADQVIFSAGSNATGSFTVAITGTQTAGSLTVNTGTIQQANGTINVANGGINVATGASWSAAGGTGARIGGTNGIAKSGGGTLFLGGTQTYSRTGPGAVLAITGGIVDFTGDFALGAVPTSPNGAALTIDGGTLRFSNTVGLTLAANRGITIGGNGATFDVPILPSIGGLQTSASGGATTSLVGSGTITKIGSGRLTFNVTQTTFTGKWRILGGLIGVPGDARLGAIPTAPLSDAIFMDGGGIRNTSSSAFTLQTNRGITLGANGGKIIQPAATASTPLTFTYGGILAGSNGGGLTIDWQDPTSTTTEGGVPGGTVFFTAVNTYDGPTTVNAGATLQLDGDATPGNGTGTFTLAGGRLNFSASRNITTDPIKNPMVFSGNTTVAMAATSATPTLNFTNSSIGGTGTITLRNEGPTGTGLWDLRFSGGNFTLASNIVMAPGLNDVNRTTRLNSFNDIGTTQTFSGVISGPGGYRRSNSTANNGGDAVFTGANTFSAGTTLTEGGIGIGIDSVGVGAGVTSGALGTGSITISPQGSNAKLFAFGGPHTLGNNIVITGSPVVISGSNDLNLAGNVDLSGGNRILQIDNTAATSFSGVISGSTGITKTGAGAVTLAGANTYQGQTWFLNGTVHVANSANLGDGSPTNGLLFNGGTLHNTGPLASAARNVQLTGLGTVDAGATIALGDVAGTGSLTKAGTGTLTINSIRASNLTVNTGVVKIADNGGAAGVSVLNTLSTGAAQLDLSDNHLIDHATGTGTWTGSNYTGITGMIASGRNGNVWNGPGIITSQTQAAGGNLTSIGVAQASDVRPATATATDLWAGQTITGTDTLVMYTYGGDATLDGKINIDDYVKIDSGIAAALTGWSNGDFNYDGKVSIDDYITVIDANIGNQNGVFFTSGGAGSGAGESVVAVPEPATLALLSVAATLRVARRRRRTS